MSKRTGDWIIYLTLTMKSRRRAKYYQKKIENAPEDTLGFHINYHYSPDRDLLTPRIFRNHLDLKFVMPVHEYLDLNDQQKTQFKVAGDITIVHQKTAAERQSSLIRNVRILQHALKKDPQNFHLNIFLAREKYNLGKYE